MSSRTDGSQYIILFPQSLKQELALLVEDLLLSPGSAIIETYEDMTLQVPCTYTPCNT